MSGNRSEHLRVPRREALREDANLRVSLSSLRGESVSRQARIYREPSHRTTVTIPRDLYDRAKERKLNVSAVLQGALIDILGPSPIDVPPEIMEVFKVHRRHMSDTHNVEWLVGRGYSRGMAPKVLKRLKDELAGPKTG